MSIDYIVRFAPLGAKVNECVTHNEDDSYTIFINVDLSAEAQERAFAHALEHIIGNDFEKADVQEIERQAHNMMLNIVDNSGVKEAMDES